MSNQNFVSRLGGKTPQTKESLIQERRMKDMSDDEKTAIQSISGLGMIVKVVDPGTIFIPSKFEITLVGVNRQEFTFPYFSGPAHRVWNRIMCLFLDDLYGCWIIDKKDLGVGKILQQKYLMIKDCKGNKEIISFLNKNTSPIEPSLADVMYCLLSDSNCVRWGQSFKEFCSEMGYSDDSIKAKECFDGCRDNWSGLIRLGVDFDKLEKILEGF